MLYLDCYGGVSGDMLLSVFLDSIDEDTGRKEAIGAMEIAGSVMSPTTISTRTIDVHGTKARILDIRFEQDHHHHHIKGLEIRGHLDEALRRIGASQEGRTWGLACLDTILEAECYVHKEPLEEIHLHETGSPDTLVDICGMVYFYDKMALEDEEVLATPVSVGKGKVKIAHGIVDVPAPATAVILEGMHYRSGPVDAELATPTGAAVLKNLIKGFVDAVPNTAVPIGRGTGTKRFDAGFINVLNLHRGNSHKQGSSLLRRDGAVP